MSPVWPRDVIGHMTIQLSIDDLLYTVSQKMRKLIIRINFDDIWQKYSKYSRIEFTHFLDTVYIVNRNQTSIFRDIKH